MRGTTKCWAAFAGAALAITAGCVPPPPDGGGGSTTVGTPAPPTPGGQGLPNTPDGQTFLGGKPMPGTSYDGSASRVQISGDGNWVVYHHGARDLAITNRPLASCPKPARTDTQIYRTNVVSGATELVSIAPNGCFANGESSFPDVSNDGRFVAYTSKSTNVVQPDGNGAQQDIFVKDMQTGETSIVNIATNGASASGGSSSRPDLNDDGSLVAYNSDATNLVAGDTNNQGDCFISKRANPRDVERVSVSNSGQQLDDFSYRCQMTGDGSAMVFASLAGNVLGTSLAHGQRIYVRDRTSNTTKLVSKLANGNPALASRPDISSNGACVTYQTSTNGVVPGDTNGVNDVFFYDMASGKTTLMSADRSGHPVSAASTRIVTNADCSRVAFVSNSNRLVPEDNNGTRDTFMRDLKAGTLFLLSVNSAEQPATPCQGGPPTTTTTTQAPGVIDKTGAEDISTRPSLSDDGRVVAFISDVCGLVPEEPQMAGNDGVIVRWMR